ncbi:MAG: hypothetical protein KJ720_06625 [Proteobacteria bacterium]|nr:hypothetical protein [Pseudomonadota bacterium]MBU1450603.1 hypothetical protein [Pseudomonadota bacterium]MBU2518684.1 hypothetical protein [Pseudomonadota bacterium]
MKAAVLFLARGVDGGLPALDSFLTSYQSHPAGHEHKLYIISKGWKNPAQLDLLRRRAQEANAEVIGLPDDGYDWGAYFRAAEQVQEDWLCFLNTHSRIERDGWLDILVGAASRPGVGVVGCTGSWGTILPTWRFIWPICSDIFRNKGVLKGTYGLIGSLLVFPPRYLRSVGHFSDFPNPHVRSNAFLTARRLILAFAKANAIPQEKKDAFRLESGRSSFTRFVEKQGLQALVAGADGRVFSPKQWRESQTFRIPGQANLIISDNQTRGYDTGSRGVRRIMELSAWGKFYSR